MSKRPIKSPDLFLMDAKKNNKKSLALKIGLLLAATAVILFVMPRVDHQSYSYEENQPWKYPLLTAEFDIPVLRDSVSANALRDSINANFVPFVKRENIIASENILKLQGALADSVSPEKTAMLVKLLSEVYDRGVMDPAIYDVVSNFNPRVIRESDENDENLIKTIDASAMLSPGDAFDFIDTTFNKVYGKEKSAITPYIARALNVTIDANIVADTLTDNKFRSQELLEANAALGVIKKGQRIVDRGEIITPQVYTNLNTYLELLQNSETDSDSMTFFTIGNGIIILLSFLVLYIFLFLYRNSFFSSLRKMTFLVIYITVFVVFAILMFEYIANGLFLVPFAAVPIVIIVFFDSRTAIFSLLVTVIITSLVATFPQEFIIMELMVGLCSTFSIHQLSRRSQLLRTALISFVVYVVCYFALDLIREGNLNNIQIKFLGYFAVNAVILSFAYVLIVVVEKLFGFTSNVTLVELSDINNPLLRRLAENAPGTFQHSMQVSTLAAEAARAVKANTQLVRTGALYHDIGKLESPIFYTENQHGINPHNGLDPETSAGIIINHVKNGIAIANKNKLPRVIKDFILEHHGRGITKYFYNTAVNNSDGESVDMEKFRYPGPNPQSRETAILMMADAVEAASRSLNDYSTASINALVDKIIDGQVADGLFKESPISFEDVETVKKTFKKRLSTIYHSRISYPELKEKVREDAPAENGTKPENQNKI